MDRNIKLASSVSLLALAAAACAPNPYYGGYNTGTTYNTNRTTTGTVSTQNRNAVTHTHCGRTHSHVLPPEGLAHHHGDGCLAGTGGGTATTTTNNYGSYGYTTQPAPYTPPTTTPYYDYSAGGNYNTGSNYNSGSNYNTGSNYNSGSYNTGSNYSNGSSSSWGNYSGYTQPKSTTTPRSNTSSRSSTTNRSTSSNTSTNANASSYTVKQGDTVFEVMRQTGTYWKDIIRLNNLQAPYTLVPGQVLRTK